MEFAALSSLEFEPYYELLSRLLPEVSGCAIFDAAGEHVWSQGGYLDPLLEQLFQERHTELQRDGTTQILSRGVGLVSLMPLKDGGGALCGWMVVVTPALGDLPSHGGTRGGSIAEKVGLVASQLTTELKLTQELNTIAAELVERYEELNLVYVTDDQVNDISKGRSALEKLVENCTTYIGVAITVLVLPDKNIVLFSTENGMALISQHHIIEAMKDDIYPWMIENTTGIVINGGVNPLRTTLCPNVPYKLAAVPVVLSEGEVVGVLAIFNHLRMPDFNNSHRNLIEVMAKKAAKIIQASYDALTGLINIHGFEWHIEQALENSRSSGVQHSLLVIGIDRLRIVNDVSGRKAGDALIRSVAMKIQSIVRDDDPVARLGGDQCGVLLKNCPLEKAREIAKAIAKDVRTMEFAWEGEKHQSSVTIGVVAISADTDSVAYALNAAELARNTAREQGVNRVEVFEENDQRLIMRRQGMRWVGRIQKALQENRMHLYAQPIRSLRAGDEGFYLEVLLRMKCEDGEILPPAAFMPAAEYYYMMPLIDRWVIKNTLREVESLMSVHPMSAPGHIAINLSGQSLGSDDFLRFIIDEIGNSVIPNEWICFEITESAGVSNLKKAQHLIRLLRGMGCAFSLDDFGTGLSSFAYLRQFDVDYLKIDGSFIKPLADDPISEAMVSAINHVGHVMGLKTIAEFVENEAITQRLVTLNVDYGQGYGLGKPEPLEDYFRREVLNQGDEPSYECG